MAQEHGVRFIPHGWNTAVGLAADLQLASAFPDTDLVEYLTGSPYVDEIAAGGWRLDRRRHVADSQHTRLGSGTRRGRRGQIHPRRALAGVPQRIISRWGAPVAPRQAGAWRIMRNPRDQATRAHRVVILFACTLAIITYVQRVAISQAAPLMQEDLGLTKVQMGLVFSVFFWMYAVFEIPWGFAGDRWGARRVLTGVAAACVVLHGRDRMGLESRLVDRRARPVRRVSGGLLSEHRPDVHQLAAHLGASPRPGHPVAQRSVGRRLRAGSGHAPGGPRELAPGL